MTASTKKYEYLSEEQVNFFLENGYVVVPKAFTPEKAAWMLKDVWVRLGLNPNDKSSWPSRIHMPKQRGVLVKDFAPKAWSAMCDLLGGEERFNDAGKYWYDSFIVNFGQETFTEEENPKHPRDLTNWHVDGDFFLHFLDSPEQALLVIPIFSDKIVAQGGGTYIAPDSIPIMAKIFESHPEGVMPKTFGYREIASRCTHFHEVTGEVGDVVLMHPFMLHSASPNLKRVPRFITNPPASLKEPFRFNLPTSELSLVEQKTLKSIGKEGPYDFKPTADRQTFPGGRHDLWLRMHDEERQRLKEYGTLPAFP